MTQDGLNSKDFFGGAVEPFIVRARLPETDLLPIIPPDAVIREGSNVAPEMRGKVPGRYSRHARDWVGLSGAWPIEGIPAPMAVKARSWPTTNVGLRAARWPGLDIDVSDAKVRDMVEQLAVAYLGTAPIRVRDNAPRSLLVYRAAGEEPLRKIRLKFQLYGADHAVELLATGQQYLVAGVHPSGAEYRWREGYGLLEWCADGLTAITADDARTFFQVLVEAILAAGGVLLNHSEQRATSEGIPVADVEPVLDVETALAALEAVPNDEIHVPTREAFLGRLAGFKAAVGREADTVRDRVCAWATRHGYADDDYFQHCWDSLTHVRASPDTLLRAARKAGWHGDAKTEFSAMTEDEIQEAIDETKAETDEEESALATAAKGLVYWPEQQIWVAIGTGELLSHSALNNHAIGLSIAPTGNSGKKSAAAKLRNSGLVRDVVGITYGPGRQRIMEQLWEGRVGIWFNRWRPGPAVRADAGRDVQRFLEHALWLLTDAERDMLLDWMAFLIQRPGVKPRWAPVIIGAQGLGKDTLLKPLIWALGAHNVAEIAPHHLLDKWTGYYENQLIVVQEMNRLDKVEVYERIKAAITGTGAGTLMVEKKFQPAYPIPNTAAFCFLTNHSDAFAIAPDDRRFLVVQCRPQERREDAYYEALHSWLDNGGNEAVACWLAARDISRFNPDKAPIWTSGKSLMLEETLPTFAKWLCAEVDQEDGRWHGRTVIAVNEIDEAVYRDHTIPGKVRDTFTSKQVGIAFRALGWYRPGEPVRINGKGRSRVWCNSAELAEAAGATLSTRIQAETKSLRFDTIPNEYGSVSEGKTP